MAKHQFLENIKEYYKDKAYFTIDNIKKYIDERLPEEYEKCLVGLSAITIEAWNTANQTEVFINLVSTVGFYLDECPYACSYL
jgi:hypothetical protein